MSTTPTPAGRRPRADAERNRARVLEAARALFTERGDDVQLPEVARAAGVGVGTVYRNFPTREALVEAAAQERFAEIAQFARRECVGSPDPAGALDRYLRHVGGALAGDRGLTTSIAGSFGTAEPKGEAREVLTEVVSDILAEAKAAGGLSPDVSVTDVMMICCGLAAVVRTGSGEWGRYVELVLSGLRAQ
ncbi:TetR/AcrR family transcriptional regulator [Flindersiella endophytica]